MKAIVSLAFLVISTWAVADKWGGIVAGCFVAGMIVFAVIRSWDDLAEQFEQMKKDLED